MNVLEQFERSVMLNGLNGLNVWNYLNAQADAEGNQKLTVSDSPNCFKVLNDDRLAKANS